jgi:hypothetical protein
MAVPFAWENEEAGNLRFLFVADGTREEGIVSLGCVDRAVVVFVIIVVVSVVEAGSVEFVDEGTVNWPEVVTTVGKLWVPSPTVFRFA